MWIAGTSRPCMVASCAVDELDGVVLILLLSGL